MATNTPSPPKLPNFVFPLKKKKTLTPGQSEAQYFMQALSHSQSGTYPFSANGLWHGGIHFTEATLTHFDKSAGIRAIADGELVAYRLDGDTKNDQKGTSYNTSFVLIRHLLEYPVGNKLTFYSLYMHMANAGAYTGLSTHVLIQKSSLRDGTGKADPYVQDGANVVKMLTMGTRLALANRTIPADNSKGGQRYRVLAIDGKPVPADKFYTIHFPHVKPLSANQGEGAVNLAVYEVTKKDTLRNATGKVKPYLHTHDKVKDRQWVDEGGKLAVGFKVIVMEPANNKRLRVLAIKKVGDNTTYAPVDGDKVYTFYVDSLKRLADPARLATHKIKSKGDLLDGTGKADPYSHTNPKVTSLELDTELTLGALRGERYQVLAYNGSDVPSNKIYTIAEASIEPLNTPEGVVELDDVVIKTPSLPLKAGQVIGQIGEYNHNTVKDRALLHLEVFTGDDIKAFTETAQAHQQDLNKAEAALNKEETALTKVKADLQIAEDEGEPDPVKNLLKTQKTTAETNLAAAKDKLKALQVLSEHLDNNLLHIPQGTVLHNRVLETVFKPIHQKTTDTVNAPLKSTAKIKDKYNNDWIKVKDKNDKELGYTSTTTPTQKNQEYVIAANTELYKKVEEVVFKPTNTKADHDYTFALLGLVQKKDSLGKNWVELDLPQASQGVTRGYMSVEDCATHGVSFVGFRHIEESSTDNISIWKKHFVDILACTPSNMSVDYLLLNDTFTKIYNDIFIHGTGDTRGDRLLSKMKDPSIRNRLSRYLVKHPSEWHWDKKKWDRLIEVYTDAEEKAHWDNERSRIAQLCFWEACQKIEADPKTGAKGFPQTDNVWHIHPVALIGAMKGCCILTEANLRNIIGTNSGDKYLDSLNTNRKGFGIKSCNDFGHFLAQVAHESGGLRLTKESGGTAHLKAKRYWPFYGRGLIQVTWKHNYTAYGKLIGEDVTSSSSARDKLREPEHAVKSAFWFWSRKKLSTLANLDDFIYITIIVNGGLNGYDDRLKYLRKFKKEMGSIEISGVYKFSESKAYNTLRGSYAWGLWSDPGKKKHKGKAKNKQDARDGYYRTLQLIKSGKKIPQGQTIYTNDLASLKKYATKHLIRLGGVAP